MKTFLDPDEIFLDSSNLPSFDAQQFEGQIERPINKKTFYFFGICFVVIGLIFLGRVFNLQVLDGKVLAARSANNTLRRIPIFADRGTLSDRFGKLLAWNNNGVRTYLDQPGLAHVLGYLGRPTAAEVEQYGYNPEELIGRDGAESIFSQELRGEPGIKIEEVDVAGNNRSDYLLQPPSSGQNLTLSIDARVQAALYRGITSLIDDGRFIAGSGVMIDVETGEIIALTNYPEYDREDIRGSLVDERHPFLNRAVAGVYTPGSIVKPIVAFGALNEKLIDPAKKIESTGQLVVPNPFFPDKPSVFKDWKVHGWVDMRRALAVSSNEYFYAIGGGAGNQTGLGIARIDRYAKLFGLGEKPGSEFDGEESGTVPTPEWKAENFDGAKWLLGDTYHTSIGQYGFQVTPLQMARATAAIANGGRLVKPTILAMHAGETPVWEKIPDINPDYLEIIREGMRDGVTDGIVTGLNLSGVKIAGKTGTAELGTSKDYVHSWIIGFFPYESPRYAFAVVMERAERSNLVGAVFAMRQAIEWMLQNTPEYF